MRVLFGGAASWPPRLRVCFELSFALMVLQVATFGFTANLHVNYRRPCVVPPSGNSSGGAVVVLRARVTQADGRKLFLEADLKSPDGSETFADATCLYVQPKPKEAPVEVQVVA
jgi:acyl-CoA thioesterase FadM